MRVCVCVCACVCVCGDMVDWLLRQCLSEQSTRLNKEQPNVLLGHLELRLTMVDCILESWFSLDHTTLNLVGYNNDTCDTEAI